MYYELKDIDDDRKKETIELDNSCNSKTIRETAEICCNFLGENGVPVLFQIKDVNLSRLGDDAYNVSQILKILGLDILNSPEYRAKTLPLRSLLHDPIRFAEFILKIVNNEGIFSDSSDETNENSESETESEAKTENSEENPVEEDPPENDIIFDGNPERIVPIKKISKRKSFNYFVNRFYYELKKHIGKKAIETLENKLSDLRDSAELVGFNNLMETLIKEEGYIRSHDIRFRFYYIFVLILFLTDDDRLLLLFTWYYCQEPHLIKIESIVEHIKTLLALSSCKVRNGAPVEYIDLLVLREEEADNFITDDDVVFLLNMLQDTSLEALIDLIYIDELRLPGCQKVKINTFLLIYILYQAANKEIIPDIKLDPATIRDLIDYSHLLTSPYIHLDAFKEYIKELKSDLSKE